MLLEFYQQEELDASRKRNRTATERFGENVMPNKDHHFDPENVSSEEASSSSSFLPDEDTASTSSSVIEVVEKSSSKSNKRP